MRILWVKVGGLWPANSGGRLRSFHILAELCRRHEVTVVTTRPPTEPPDYLARYLNQCTRIVAVPYTPAKHGSWAFIRALVRSWFSRLPVDLYKNRIAEMQRTVAALLADEHYDLCIADFLTALPNVPLDGPVPVIHFSHNVEHMIWKRLCSNETSLLRRLLLHLEWRKMRRYERAACRSADLTIAVSETDRQHLLELAPTSSILAVPTGVDVENFRPAGVKAEQELELVFSGSMDWFPNEDAMLWFCDAILPLIRQEQPGVTLTIAGRNPSERVQRLALRVGVKVTGTVEDIRPFVERASVYIVPLRIGGGTRLKIFEGLAMGKAIVSTTVGAEGLPLEDGKHILLADSPAAFAEKVLTLMRDAAARTRLGQAGRQLVEAHYSWSRVADAFEALCRTALQSALFNLSVLKRGSNP